MTGQTEKKWWGKWDKAATSFDFMNNGIELRYGEHKRQWFSQAVGRTLLVAVGTGLDLQYFQNGNDVLGIDISWKMLEKAKEKSKNITLNTKLVRTDVQMLGFMDNTFDTVVTSCTFCSVPDPIKGLCEIRRVLKTGGKLLMFEHVRSDIFWMGPMMDMMTYVSRKFGPDLNRRTGKNIIKAGFKLLREINVYLDMVKLFEAV
ncbi:MAG: class I SAM-dependent methyltransferase [Candidatus Scalinduaceae bacterium]